MPQELKNTVVSAKEANLNETTGSENIGSSRYLWTYHNISSTINKLIKEASAQGNRSIIININDINKYGDLYAFSNYLLYKEYILSFFSKNNDKLFAEYDNTKAYNVGDYCWRVTRPTEWTYYKYYNIYRCVTAINKDPDSYYNDDGSIMHTGHWTSNTIFTINNETSKVNTLTNLDKYNELIENLIDKIYYIKIEWNLFDANPLNYVIEL